MYDGKTDFCRAVSMLVDSSCMGTGSFSGAEKTMYQIRKGCLHGMQKFRTGCYEVVWEFEIDGKTYSVQDNLSDRVKIGSSGMLYINPDNAEEFSNNKWKLAIVFSLAAVVLTVFAFSP